MGLKSAIIVLVMGLGLMGPTLTKAAQQNSEPAIQEYNTESTENGMRIVKTDTETGEAIEGVSYVEYDSRTILDKLSTNSAFITSTYVFNIACQICILLCFIYPIIIEEE